MEQSVRQEAIDLIDDVDGIRNNTRSTLRAMQWQYLVIWSLVFLGAALTGLVPGWDSFADLYWLFAVPAGVAATAVISWRLELNAAVRRRPHPYWMVGLGIAIATSLAGALLPETAVVVMIWVILGLGFAAFAWIDHLTFAAVLLVAMSLLSGLLGVIVDDTFELYSTLGLAFSAALAGIAAGIRLQASR